MSAQTFFEKRLQREMGCHFVSINIVMWRLTYNNSVAFNGTA